MSRDSKLASWLAFASQKLDEVVTLARLIDNRTTAIDEQRVIDATLVLDARRAVVQRRKLRLPLFPTTTIVEAAKVVRQRHA